MQKPQAMISPSGSTVLSSTIRDDVGDSWPPPSKHNDDYKQWTTFDLLHMIQNLQSQVLRLNATVGDQVALSNKYKQEISLLRMRVGLPDDGVYPDATMQAIIATLSNTIAHNALYPRNSTHVYCKGATDINLLERLGLMAARHGVDVPIFKSWKGSQRQDQLEVTLLNTELNSVQEKLRTNQKQNSGLTQQILKLQSELRKSSEELEASRQEQETTQSSCRDRVIQYQQQRKECEQELSSTKKIVSELWKLSDEQSKNVKQQSEELEAKTSELESLKKSSEDLRKQTDRQHRDLDNKNIAIKKLQKSLREALDDRNKIHVELTTEKRKHNKKLAEDKNEMEKGRKSLQKLVQNNTKKDEELKEQVTQLKLAVNRIHKQESQLEALTKENKDLQGTVHELRLENKLGHDSLCKQNECLAQLSSEMMEVRESYTQRDAAVQLLNKQLRYVMERLQKGGYAHLTKMWQQDWIKYCKSNPTMQKLHQNLGVSFVNSGPGAMSSEATSHHRTETTADGPHKHSTAQVEAARSQRQGTPSAQSRLQSRVPVSTARSSPRSTQSNGSLPATTTSLTSRVIKVARRLSQGAHATINNTTSNW